MRFLIVVCFLLLTSLPAHAAEVVSIIDGDTFRVRERKKEFKVRIAVIDAPELSQDQGKASKDYLQTLLLDQKIRLHKRTKDFYGRTLAYVSTPTCKDVSLIMVESGQAWVYKNKKGKYLEAQKRAQVSRKGLWKYEKQTAPWIWRQEQKSKT